MDFFGEIMAFVLIGAGIFLSFPTGFIQFTHFFPAVRAAFSDSGSGEGVTSFQATATALAGSIGTANIAGVAGAIVTGGPGAVFWMWVAAVFGMATKFSEIALAVRFRGGAMVCIERGMGKRFRPLAAAFAVFGALSCTVGTGLVQSNTVANSVLSTASALSPGVGRLPVLVVSGLAAAALTALVIFGGAVRIGRVSEKAVPVMAVIYALAAVTVIIMNIKRIPAVLLSIASSAFGLRPAAGGISSALFLRALRVGAARGVYSNEAGVGSAPMAHANANDTDPVRQGMIGIFEVFFDTMVMCTLTALALLSSGIAIPYGDADASGAALVAQALRPALGTFSEVFVSAMILVFAFTSIIAWSVCGESCVKYLFGEMSAIPFRIVFLIPVVIGAVLPVSSVWRAGEALNYLMALPNVAMLLSLSRIVKRDVAEYKMFEKSPRRHYNKRRIVFGDKNGAES
ncbi:MAG: alanine:cation symporter family protein [Clostridia bacterium]|nr:alanine:cation symporter family protein [Clostridia bacterium]